MEMMTMLYRIVLSIALLIAVASDSLFAQDAGVIFERAHNYFKSGDSKMAVALFKQAIKLKPESGVGHYYLAESMQREKSDFQRTTNEDELILFSYRKAAEFAAVEPEGIDGSAKAKIFSAKLKSRRSAVVDNWPELIKKNTLVFSNPSKYADAYCLYISGSTKVDDDSYSVNWTDIVLNVGKAKYLQNGNMSEIEWSKHKVTWLDWVKLFDNYEVLKMEFSSFPFAKDMYLDKYFLNGRSDFYPESSSREFKCNFAKRY